MHDEDPTETKKPKQKIEQKTPAEVATSFGGAAHTVCMQWWQMCSVAAAPQGSDDREWNEKIPVPAHDEMAEFLKLINSKSTHRGLQLLFKEKFPGKSAPTHTKH